MRGVLILILDEVLLGRWNEGGVIGWICSTHGSYQENVKNFGRKPEWEDNIKMYFNWITRTWKLRGPCLWYLSKLSTWREWTWTLRLESTAEALGNRQLVMPPSPSPAPVFSLLLSGWKRLTCSYNRRIRNYGRPGGVGRDGNRVHRNSVRLMLYSRHGQSHARSCKIILSPPPWRK
jgi:hypothetical protein